LLWHKRGEKRSARKERDRERKRERERERERERWKGSDIGCFGGGRLGGGCDAASWQLSHQPLMNELARVEPPTLPTPLAN